MCRLNGIIFLLVSTIVLAGAPSPHRPRVALVLEGGGALGFAHIGAIEYLEQHHIPVDLVVGTSMGGLVGGLYAIGKSPAEIERLTETIDWDVVLSGKTPFQDLSFRRKEDRVAFPNRLQLGLKNGVSLPAGLNSGQQVGLVFDRATLAYEHNLNFDDFPIPFRCVATDVTLGRAKVFDRGSISLALRATMSIPAVFAPIVIDGHVYTDGGAVDNLPVDIAKRAGADVVIAVYLNTGPPSPNTYVSMFSVASRNVSIMISTNELQNLQAADIVLSADVHEFTSASFKKGAEIIPRGFAAAERKATMLSSLALNDAEWQAYIGQREAKIKRDIPVPQFVSVIGAKPDYDETLRRNLANMVGKPVDPPAIEEALTQITGTGVIETANYTTAMRDGVPGLNVFTHEKTYAPPFLDLGVTIDGSDPDNVLFGMAARLTFLDLGGYRSEWRTDAFFGSSYGVDSDYYRPFTKTSKWFFDPHVYAINSPLNLYFGQSKLQQYRLEHDGLGLDIGYAINRRSEIRAGQDVLRFESIPKISSDLEQPVSVGQTISKILYRYYGVDNAELPRQGLNVQAGFNWVVQGSGEPNFKRGELQASYFQKVSRRGSLIFTADGGTHFGANIDAIGLQGFTVGGPFRLGAYGQNQLVGSEYFLFQTGYEHKVMSFAPLFGEGLYVLGLAEGSKVYDTLLPSAYDFSNNVFAVDGSAALVARTILGPVFVGAGFGNHDQRKWWFGIGRVF